ncbi:hypothetical protein FF38_13867 [Lucilia cuprina]|uniref:Uncharacterized protein n=1 Tax=Lucilia cuprina TaxID=7375 RepID=A0A0L0CT11_LUCCU|nr:hypothetical protein FF38_13867 [Lucilia cuprina]
MNTLTFTTLVSFPRQKAAQQSFILALNTLLNFGPLLTQAPLQSPTSKNDFNVHNSLKKTSAIISDSSIPIYCPFYFDISACKLIPNKIPVFLKYQRRFMVNRLGNKGLRSIPLKFSCTCDLKYTTLVGRLNCTLPQVYLTHLLFNKTEKSADFHLGGLEPPYE